jgi:hypothetical protein
MVGILWGDAYHSLRNPVLRVRDLLRTNVVTDGIIFTIIILIIIPSFYVFK